MKITKGLKRGSAGGYISADFVIFHMPPGFVVWACEDRKVSKNILVVPIVPKCHLIGSTPYFEKSQVRLLWNNYIYDPLLVVKVSPPSWILFTTRLESQNRFTTSTSRKKVFVTNSRDTKRDVTCQYSDV